MSPRPDAISLFDSEFESVRVMDPDRNDKTNNKQRLAAFFSGFYYFLDLLSAYETIFVVALNLLDVFNPTKSLQ